MNTSKTALPSRQLLLAITAFAALTPIAPAANLYWDSNGATTGAGATPNGTWGVDSFWSTNSTGGAGTFSTSMTTADTGFFSAGTDAINPYTVTVSGTQASGNLTFQGGTPTLTGGTIALGANKALTANATLNGTATIASALTVNTTAGGTTLLTLTANNGPAATDLLLTGPISATSANVYQIRLSGAGNGRIEGAISGHGGSLTGAWSGNWTIAGNQALGSTIITLSIADSKLIMGDSLSDVQSWSGTTSLSSPSAVMTVKSAATTGAFGIRGAGGTLDVIGSVAATGLTFGINATTTDSSQYGVLKLSGGNATFNGAGSSIYIYGTGSKIIGGAASYGTLTMNHTSGVTLTGNVTLGGAGTNENNFNLVKAGINTLTLSGANTYTGSTTINAGTLALANQNAIQNSTLVMTGGGNVSFSSAEVANAFALGGLSGASAGSGYNIALTNNASTAIALTVGTNNASTTYAGVLSGNGSLTKTGSGTLTLSGANTYNGTTTVNAGSLVVNGTLGASSTLTVANGATLGGTGTINGAATVNGNLRPGNSPGVLTFGSNLSLTSTASITMEINGTARGTQYDGINVTGLLVYGGTLTFEFGSAFLLGGESFSLFNAGSATAGLTAVVFSGAYGVGSFNNNGSGNWSYNSDGKAWAFSESNGQLTITTAVPEPSTGMLLGAFFLIAGWVIARRHKTATA